MIETEDCYCPGCGEGYVEGLTGSNIHFYEHFRCSNGHEWVVPYTQERIDYWMKINET